jgi:hypothetical protein
MQSKQQQDHETPLWGAAQIAAYVGRTVNQVRHMIRVGSLPARKVGGRLCAMPSEIDRTVRGEPR